MEVFLRKHKGVPHENIVVRIRMKRGISLRKRLMLLLTVCLIPLTILIMYVLLQINRISDEYDDIVQKITSANEYNIKFKEDMDYDMYIIVANSERAHDIVDTKRPFTSIEQAREVFENLSKQADTDAARSRLLAILKSIDTLEDCVSEIVNDAAVSGNYETNMERLDLDIRVLTELIQEQIQYYIYEQNKNLEELRIGIHNEVEGAIHITVVILIIILVGALIISNMIMKSITLPIRNICKAAECAASGDFGIRAHEGKVDEIASLNDSFNSMVEKIGKLVEDIRVEELNLRAAELRLLQEQINPHFLYNTLDNIIWLAESGESEQVVNMVSALSDFFRTTLSKGKDFISVSDERAHIQSYLQIQQFRYRDILEYEIDIDENIMQCEILKLTLQPLVENALYHGIKNKRGGGRIKVTGRADNDMIVFCVSDNGIGMTSERLEQVQMIIDGKLENNKEKGGFGLFNVNQRLVLNYGSAYNIKIESEYEKGTKMWINIPYKRYNVEI